MASWFVEDNGQSLGPLTLSEVQARVEAGQINGETLVWSSGMTDWQSLSQTSLRQLVVSNDPPRIPTPFGARPAHNWQAPSATPPSYGMPQAPAPQALLNNNLASFYQGGSGVPFVPGPKNTRSTVGVIMAGMSLSFLMVPFLNMIMGLVGMTLGISGLRRAKTIAAMPSLSANAAYLGRESKGMSKAAIWIGLAGAIFGLFFTVLMMTTEFNPWFGDMPNHKHKRYQSPDHDHDNSIDHHYNYRQSAFDR